MSTHARKCRATARNKFYRGKSRGIFRISTYVRRELRLDIAHLTETWLNLAILRNLTDFSGYTTYHLDCSDGREGGGIAMPCHALPCQLLGDLSKQPLESLWLLFRRPRMPRSVTHILLGCIYYPCLHVIPIWFLTL